MTLLVAIAEFCTSFDRIDNAAHTAFKPLLNGYSVLPFIHRAGNALEATSRIRAWL